MHHFHFLMSQTSTFHLVFCSFLISFFMIYKQCCITIKKIVTFIFHIFFPPFCIGCKQYTIDADEILCFECQTKICPLISKKIQITQKKFVVVHCIGKYETILQTLILAKKNSSIATSKYLGLFAGNFLRKKNIEFDFLVPIPLHWTRYASRGYNQADEICSGISSIAQIPIANILQRPYKTKPQVECSFKERKENVKGKITVKRSVAKNSHILLVDDVMTTGATIKEASKVLLLQGYRVTVFVIARTV
jgi:competence protein ComFC